MGENRTLPLVLDTDEMAMLIAECISGKSRPADLAAPAAIEMMLRNRQTFQLAARSKLAAAKLVVYLMAAVDNSHAMHKAGVL